MVNSHSYLQQFIAQSVQRRATGWTNWVLFPTVQDFSLLYSVQTASGTHTASYTMGTVMLFPRG
jgi:hypothetical protein